MLEAVPAARPRFPAAVRDVLTTAGWHSRRDVSAGVERWLDGVYHTVDGARAGLPLFPVAAAALAEFGGLRLSPPGRVGSTNAGFAVDIVPAAGRVVLEQYTSFAAELGMPVFPFAWYEDGSSDVVIAADSRVFLLHPTDTFLVGDSVDAAITELILGPQLRVFETPAFEYHALYPDDRREPPATGLICHEIYPGPTRAVLWNHVRRAWLYHPAVAARFLFDDELQQRKRVVSRGKAERIAEHELGVPLPSQADLAGIARAGEAGRAGRT